MQSPIHERLKGFSGTDLSDAMGRLTIFVRAPTSALERSFDLKCKAWPLRHTPDWLGRRSGRRLH